MDFADIAAIVEARRSADSALKRQMINIQQRYNGDYVLPMSDVEGAPTLPPLTPALVADAIDNIALQAASVMPDITCPAVDASKQSGKRSREYASIRARALDSTWHASRMKLVSRRMFRHLAGYATTSIVVVPDFDLEMPTVRVRDPLNAYPELKDPEDLSLPRDCAWIYGKSAGWIAKHYPEAKVVLDLAKTQTGDIWDMVEWMDEDEVVVGILGPRFTATRPYGETRPVIDSRMELRRWPNRAGVVTTVTPHRVTLDKVASQVSHVVGIVDLMARLLALDILATEKSIFPDTYILGQGNQAPTIVGDKWADGRTGEVNLVLDAQAVGQLRSAPDPNNKVVMDRLERNARVSSANVPQFGGETYGALRTGRGIDALGGMAVEPKVQELQEVAEAAFEHLNEAIFATYEGYWPGKKYTLFTGVPGEGSQVEFTPETHIEIRHNAVSYAVPGTDVAGTTVQLGQMLGAKAISLKTFRYRHPWIKDPDAEERRILEEEVEEAVKLSFLEQARQGQIPLIDAIAVEKYLRQGDDIITAIEKADQDARARQAEMPEPVGPDGQPIPPGAMPPEAAPGLAMPGMGAEAGAGGGAPVDAYGRMSPALPATVTQGTPDQQNFRKLLLALNAGRSRR